MGQAKYRQKHLKQCFEHFATLGKAVADDKPVPESTSEWLLEHFLRPLLAENALLDSHAWQHSAYQQALFHQNTHVQAGVRDFMGALCRTGMTGDTRQHVFGLFCEVVAPSTHFISEFDEHTALITWLAQQLHVAPEHVQVVHDTLLTPAHFGLIPVFMAMERFSIRAVEKLDNVSFDRESQERSQVKLFLVRVQADEPLTLDELTTNLPSPIGLPYTVEEQKHWAKVVPLEIYSPFEALELLDFYEPMLRASDELQEWCEARSVTPSEVAATIGIELSTGYEDDDGNETDAEPLLRVAMWLHAKDEKPAEDEEGTVLYEGNDALLAVPHLLNALTHAGVGRVRLDGTEQELSSH